LRCPIIRCENLAETLDKFSRKSTTICILDSHSEQSLFDYCRDGQVIYALGNETDGVSENVRKLATTTLAIPLHNKVESLNVAVTAAIIAFTVAR